MFIPRGISAVLLSSLFALILAGCDATATPTGESTSELSSAAPGSDTSARSRPERRRGPKALFDEFDADGDGAITITDLPEPKRQHLADADANRDGALTRDELEEACPNGCGGHAPKMRDASGPPRGPFDGRGPEALFERFDPDQDGSIAIADLPEPKQHHVGAADVNQDGKLTKEELTSFHEARQKEIDKNGDGTLSEDERAAARVRFMTERFAGDDVNQDGALTADELDPWRWDHMRTADANGDAKLTRREIETAISDGTLRPRHGRRHGPHGLGPSGGSGRGKE